MPPDRTPSWHDREEARRYTPSMISSEIRIDPEPIAPRYQASAQFTREALTNDGEGLLKELFDAVADNLRRQVEEYLSGDGDWRGWWGDVRVDWPSYDDHGMVQGSAWPTHRDQSAAVWRGWRDSTIDGPRVPDIATLRRDRDTAARQNLIQGTRDHVLGLRRRVAERKAERLLRSFLNDEQNRTLAEHHGFEVVGSEGGHYWIGRGHVGNVYLIDSRSDGSRWRCASLCAHISDYVPDSDHHLAQMLFLEADEPGFRMLANASACNYAVPGDLALTFAQREAPAVRIQETQAYDFQANQAYDRRVDQVLELGQHRRLFQHMNLDV